MGDSCKTFSSTDCRVIEDAMAYASERLRALRIDSASLEALELALLEALGNVVRHAAGRAHDFSIAIKRRGRTASVEVVDFGPGFELRRARMPQAYAEHGRGLPLMQRLCDSVEYFTASNGDGNRLILKKRVHDAGPVGL
jgi:anti-sigma regulatory factor (Ser/Thr protein kinase)